MTWSAQLRALRIARGVTQQQLADRLGVRQATVAGYEQSKNLSESVVRRYVTALGVDHPILLSVRLEEMQ